MRRRKEGHSVTGRRGTVRITATKEDRGEQIRENPVAYFEAARQRAREQVDSELDREGLAGR